MTTQRVAWVDASGGLSGDMLLGACIGAGMPLARLRQVVSDLALPEQVSIEAEVTSRAGLAAVRVIVQAGQSDRIRTLRDIEAVLAASGIDPTVRDRASKVFGELARAEAAVHGVSPDQVHFHEVGALDSIADIVGVVAGLHTLGVARLVCSPVALGGGVAQTGHGSLPLPGPAVLQLLKQRTAPAFGGPRDLELATPTGVALMVALADGFGPMPPLAVGAIGVGAGHRDPVGHANITRLIVGTETEHADETAVIIEANVDDLDPRLWPPTLSALMDAGASDAWLTPVLMKKGRPAHLLSVLSSLDGVDALQRVIFRYTTTIGLRTRSVNKVALPRHNVVVQVDGAPIRVKVALLDGQVVNASPEYDDVSALADRSRQSPKLVLEKATAAALRAMTDLCGKPEDASDCHR